MIITIDDNENDHVSAENDDDNDNACDYDDESWFIIGDLMIIHILHVH